MTLEDPILLRNLDVNGGLDLLMNYPEQVAEMLARDPMAPIPLDWPRGRTAYRAVVIVGFGTAGAAADAIAQLAKPVMAIPVFVVREPVLPAYVGPDTLVIVCSYSGDTPDCASAYRNASTVNARVVCVTRGGALGELARETPILLLPGHLRPEFALPALFFGILGVLQELALVERSREDEAETLTLLKRQRATFAPEQPQARNGAKALAAVLNGKLPVIYAGEPHLAPVAHRWRDQIHGSGKLQALSSVFPEVTHSDLLTWRNAAKQSSQWAVVVVHDRTESATSAALIEGASGAIPDEIDVHEVFVEGRSMLARLWTGLYFADITSAYLALAWGEEPAAV